MIKTHVPKHLYKVTRTPPHDIELGEVFLLELKYELNSDVQHWLNIKLGYVPNFISPVKPYINLPTEEFATAFRLAWY